MFFFFIVILALLMFSGGGYYGHKQGFYGPRTAYTGIGLGWIVILFLLFFLMPQWGSMQH